MHNKQLFYLVKVMASCKMACRDFAKLRAFFGAKAVGIRAAGPETASARWIQRTRNIALKRNSVRGACNYRVCLRYSRNKALSVWMRAVCYKLIAVGELNELAEIHYAYTV